MSNYFYISAEKERQDLVTLSKKIIDDNFIDSDLIIVTCSPDYSSLGTMILNHSLSSINKNELFEQLSLELPYPTMQQIFNKNTFEYELFDKYLFNWLRKNIFADMKYLFFDSGTLTGKNFNKIKNILSKEPESNYRFASLYVQDDCICKPDYYIEEFNFKKQGGLLFSWENPQNPNWNY